jgi:restriction system protein
MARRRRNESILDLLVDLPWWVSVLVAGLVYAALKYWLPVHPLGNMYLAALAKGLEPLAGYAGLFFLIPAPLSLLRSRHRRRLLDQQSGLDSIRAMTWREFEMLCGEAYRRKGFAVQKNGLGGADGGIDLILRRGGETWLVQCKRWKTSKVGVKEIRELYGIVAAEGASRGVFITSGKYTQDARAFATGKPLDLLDGPALLELVREVQTGPAPVAAKPPARIEPVVSPPPVPEPVIPSTPVAPACPRCGASMVLRTATRGGNAGGRFWGCSNFPKCRGVVQA